MLCKKKGEITMLENNKYLTTKQASSELGVVVSTIYKYVKEGHLKPVYDDKWQIDETLLFHPEDIKELQEKFHKPGLTTGEAAKELGLHPTTVASYISKGILRASKSLYKGRELYFISKEEVEKLQKSNLIKKNQLKKAFHTNDGYYLFQSLSNGEKFVRIMNIQGDEGTVVDDNGNEITLLESKIKGFEVKEKYRERKYITKKGYAKFIFPLPAGIRSSVFNVIELFYQKLGHRNIKLEVDQGYIHLEVKPITLGISQATHETEIALMEKHLVEGKIYQRVDKLLVDSDLEPIVIHVPTKLKEQIKRNSDTAKTTIEEYVLELVRKGMGAVEPDL